MFQTSNKERERENKMNDIRPYRAIPIGQKNFVYGWYVEINNHHYILIQVEK